MIERILKIVYVFAMFINVGLYGVSFILKLNVIPIQVDLSGLSAVEKREMLSNLAINYPLGESMYYVAIGLSIVLAICIAYIFECQTGFVEKTEISLIYFWNFWIL